MGVKDWLALPAIAGGASASAASYRARITAPTLAFLHGICDPDGGLPNYGTPVDFTLRAGGSVELRSSYRGEILDATGRPSGIWVYDPGKLAERVQVVRQAPGSSGR